MTNLSVNVNKIALLRNSRGTGVPDLVEYTQIAIDEGVDGITVHPRDDARHITLEDLISISKLDAISSDKIEFNIEGDARLNLLDFIKKTVYCHQFTLVPVTPGEITSSRGWSSKDNLAYISQIVKRFKKDFNLKRVSFFTDATKESVDFAKKAGADAVEFYTGDYALNYRNSDNDLNALIQSSEYARSQGLRIHAGHDLNLQNLPKLLKAIHPDELSIGHEIICDALRFGYKDTIRKYIDCVKNY
jgi:pyridoxine 5-phosphate synthase